MERTKLCEMDSGGEYYIWSNKHVERIIHSRIDRILANFRWFQNQLYTTFRIMHPNVSNHTLFWMKNREKNPSRRYHFKFINFVVDMGGYAEIVKKSWNEPIIGRLMYVMWEKLKQSQNVARKLRKPIMNLKKNILEVKSDLTKAQQELGQDLMCTTLRFMRSKTILHNSLNLMRLKKVCRISGPR